MSSFQILDLQKCLQAKPPGPLQLIFISSLDLKTLVGLIQRKHICKQLSNHVSYFFTQTFIYQEEDIKRLEKIQRKAARFVKKDYRNTSSVTTMMKDLGWETLQRKRKVNRLTMMYKIVNKHVAIPPTTISHQTLEIQGQQFVVTVHN